MQREVKVIPYDPQWRNQFTEEATKIAAVFADQLIAVHHIGSTSVPGLSGKPVIDILPVVRDIACVDDCIPDMNILGYQYLGEYGIPGRRFFYKPSDPVRTHHVHIFENGSPEIERHLTFRDYMRVHPEEAKDYGKLKEELARQLPTDIQSYIAGKDAFVKGIDRKAAEWRKQDHGQPLLALALRLHPHQDLRLELEHFAAQHNLQAACILTCVGSLSQATLRLADQSGPTEFENKFEIVSLTGTISPDGVHMHISLSDGTGHTIGGHLLVGCLIYTTAEIVIGIIPGLSFTRPLDPVSTYDELEIQQNVE